MPQVHDWDDVYANGAYIAGAEKLPAIWAERSAKLLGGIAPERALTIEYGPHPRQKCSVFLPPAAPKGLFVFIHGGYWTESERQEWLWCAKGALARGWAAAVPGYVLCPEITIPKIGRMVARAIAAAAERVPGAIRIAGHSAGGQLAARMVSGSALLPPQVAARVGRVMPISPVAELRDIARTSMNADLRLTPTVIRRESPARLVPQPGVTVLSVVGSLERPVFVEQAAMLARVWPGCDLRVVDGAHHFDVVDGLADPASSLCEFLFGD